MEENGGGGERPRMAEPQEEGLSQARSPASGYTGAGCPRG